MSKTFTAKPDTLERDWYLVDATDKTLGRLASEIALRLRGKHKPEYTPNIDTGDYIIVVNAAKLSVTGKKRNDKVYYRHTGKVLEIAVKGMLPRGPLGRAMLKKLKIYAGSEHQHSAQQPVALEI